jgi:alpha-L-rhamnosidase
MPRPSRLLRLLLATSLLATVARALTVDGLRVEDRVQPLGIDAAQPRLAWLLHADQRAQIQSAYQIRIASSLENITAGRADVWDSGKVVSADSFGIEYAGPALRSDTRYFWQVRVWDGEDRASGWSTPAWWQMGLLAPADWKAQWIGSSTEAGSPLLRRDFQVGRQVVRATAYAYASGWYRLFVNGTELTERVLTPVNSNYPKGLFYDTYDVTSLVTSGGNAVGLWLGHGYNQSYSKWGYRWNVPAAGLLQLELLFSDGTTQTVVSDGTWQWTPSPVLENDIYHGETYDARRELAGWSRAGFAATTWQPVALRDTPAGPLKSCPFPGLAVTADLAPVKVTEPMPGVFIFDLGQNIAGWTRLQVSGPAGTRVTLRHAENLLPDGNLDVKTNRAARATDTYLLSGRGDETYEPRFTYHGFRYVEVTGYPGTPTADAITGRVVRAAVEDAGSFRTSDALVNRIHENFKWTIANNLYGIPTDTATRDERTPCQMDSLAVEDAAIANFALGPYYTKWLNDIAGDGGDLPNWTGDQVVLPSLLHEYYGDRRILAQHYPAMKQVVDKFTASADTHKYWSAGFGDWAAPNMDGSYEGSFSEGELVNTAFYYRCARLVAETAALLGHSTDQARYATLAEQIRTHFAQRFFNPVTATYGSGRQVTAILPLAFGLVAPEHRSAVVAALQRRIEQQDGGRLDTGIFGTRYLFEVLIDHGLTDLAYSLLTQPVYPGYADQIAQGATTTWEQWTFGGSMQTHNHAMFAGPDATFFSRLGGIQPAAPGFREIIIRPALPAALSFVECSRETPAGRIASHWRRTGDKLVFRISIPANATAQVFIPAAAARFVTESGRPVLQAPGVLRVSAETGAVAVTIGSGDYEFSTPAPTALN